MIIVLRWTASNLSMLRLVYGFQAKFCSNILVKVSQEYSEVFS